MAESKLKELSIEFSIDIINLVKELKQRHESIIPGKVQVGEFGADMKVSILNDGPVTIIADSKELS